MMRGKRYRPQPAWGPDRHWTSGAPRPVTMVERRVRRQAARLSGSPFLGEHQGPDAYRRVPRAEDNPACARRACSPKRSVPLPVAPADVAVALPGAALSVALTRPAIAAALCRLRPSCRQPRQGDPEGADSQRPGSGAPRCRTRESFSNLIEVLT